MTWWPFDHHAPIITSVFMCVHPLLYDTSCLWMYSYHIEAGALVQWLKLPAWKVGDRGFEPHSHIKVSKERNVSCRLVVKIKYCGEPLWPRGSMLGLRLPLLESCVWRAVSSHPSHYPQEVLLAQFSLYVHKGGLKPHSFHFSCHIDTHLP